MNNNRKSDSKSKRTNTSGSNKQLSNRSYDVQKKQKSVHKYENSDKSEHKKVGINTRNKKAKYSDDEIARARYLESKAIFLVRDRIHNDNIDTKNKWISITNLESKDKYDRNGKYNPEILSFDVEIYDKTEHPEYEEWMTEDYKHQLTYEVAEGDIAKQQSQEVRHNKKVNRPSYHVEVTEKHTNESKTEYQVKNIKKINQDIKRK